MLILAFDTALGACSVAVWEDGTTLASERAVMDRGQAEALVPMIEAALDAAAREIGAVDRIAVTVGPGSFTGVRVGLATARGLGLALGRPVVGATTGEVLAGAARRAGAETPIVSMIDTKRGDLYVELFTAALETMNAPVVLAVDQVRGWLTARGVESFAAVGDGAAMLGRAAYGDAVLPDPAVLAALAAERAPLPQGPLPVYVRAPNVTLPRAK